MGEKKNVILRQNERGNKMEEKIKYKRKLNKIEGGIA